MGFLRGDLVDGYGAQGSEEIEIGLCVFACLGGDLGNFEIEFALIFFLRLPLHDPPVQILELRTEEFKGGGAADHAQDGEEDVVAGVIGRGQDVEDGGQDGKGEAGTIGRGGFDGSGEMLADFGKEFVEVW